MDYEQMRDWRSLCEYLNGQWYKFASVPEIEQALPGIDRRLVSAEGRAIRRQLWEAWRIQFASYGSHPILSFYHSRAARRAYKDDRGWQLLPMWEAKLHFLEQMVLFDRDPDTMVQPWRVAFEQRMQARRLQFADKLQMQRDRFEAGNCWNCGKPMIALMLDCSSCGRSYEDYEFC